MNIIHRAAQMANTYHIGQTRACGEPYINHPARVAGRVMILDARAEVLIQDDMIAAAWLHDVYEDTRFIPPTLTNQFNAEVDQLVIELTNVFTKEAYPDRNREQRKASEIARLAGISPQAQIIKLCDRIDNLRTIGAKDRGFALLYCDESDALTEVLTVAPDLRAEIFKLTEDFRTNEY